MIYNTALYIKINKVIKKEKLKWEKVHNRKIEHLRKLQSNFTRPKVRIISNIIHNFSSYHLTPEEKYALSFRLDQYILTKGNENKIKTEFESFFYQLQKYTSNLDKQIRDELKSKMRRTCENYSKVKVPYKFQHVIDNLSKNKNIIIIRQDKGRGVTILDRKNYIEKCLNVLDAKQFRKLSKDPTKTLERKMQRVLRKIKCNLEEKEYEKLYPTGSKPGLFYSTEKVYKLKIGEGLKELTVILIISNIRTATYETAKYLNTSLTKSQHNVLSTDDFIQKIKNERITKGFKMISFDLKKLFTNVPIHKTIEIILSKVYQEKKIKTSIPKSILRELSYLCTKEVHFMFNDEIYIQSDGVAMGSPLGPLLANIFMTSLEEEVIPKLTPYLYNWKRYVNDTHAYVNSEKVDFILTKLNSYHPNIQFTFELEKKKQITCNIPRRTY